MITTLERLDREAASRHELTLMVRDRGTPLPRRSFARVVINVVDMNDHAPEFLAPQYEARVYSQSVPGSTVAQVTAVDRDHADNAVVTYSIVSGEFFLYMHKGVCMGYKQLRATDHHLPYGITRCVTCRPTRVNMQVDTCFNYGGEKEG